jgi:hypothetical protein
MNRKSCEVIIYLAAIASLFSLFLLVRRIGGGAITIQAPLVPIILIG